MTWYGIYAGDELIEGDGGETLVFRTEKQAQSALDESIDGIEALVGVPLLGAALEDLPKLMRQGLRVKQVPAGVGVGEHKEEKP